MSACFARSGNSPSRDWQRAIEDASAQFLLHGNGFLPAVNFALAEDPDHVSVICFKGIALAMIAKTEATAEAKACLSTAQALKNRNERDAIFLKALKQATQGRFKQAAEAIEGSVVFTALEAKLSHQLRFMAGDARGMLRSTARFLSDSNGAPGESYVQGCHAFALEEAGDFDLAREFGELALERDPSDVWAGHAVAHTFEMQGLAREGLRWLEERHSWWNDKNNFRFHVSWHRALFQLKLRNFSDVLRLYDEEIRADKTDDFRDFANASSLLQRLEWEGVEVGDRWCELQEHSVARCEDDSLVFALLHRLLALRRLDCQTAQQKLMNTLRRMSVQEGGQSEAVRRVGLPLAEAIIRAPSEQWSLCLNDLPMIGGSHAQRDVFLLDLRDFAKERGLRDLLDNVEAARQSQRPDPQVKVL